jgi:hypothetical protein
MSSVIPVFFTIKTLPGLLAPLSSAYGCSANEKKGTEEEESEKSPHSKQPTTWSSALGPENFHPG